MPIQKPTDGIYRKRSANMLPLGSILLTGSMVIKNQNIENDIIGKRLIFLEATKSSNAKMTNPIKTIGSNKELDGGNLW